MTMTRALISIDRELYDSSRKRAETLGVSFAEYVRRLLAEDLREPRQRPDPSIIFDLGRSAGSDVGRDKDAMIGEAVAADQARKQARKPSR
jgi:hypothetical protein